MNGKKTKSPLKHLSLPIISFLVFSVGFLPALLVGWLFLYFINFSQIWHYFLIPFIIYIEIALVIISQLLISGLIIKIFRIRYQPGSYPYNFKDKNSFRWIVLCTVYTPGRKIIETFPVGSIKNVYYRLLGMKLGKNSLVGGVIKDPCVTEIGDNVTIGEYAIIYGHIHNYEKNTISIKKVKIENNCIIGAGAIVMPGVTMEKGSILGAGGLATKNQVLKQGKTYVGNPAKEISLKEK